MRFSLPELTPVLHLFGAVALCVPSLATAQTVAVQLEHSETLPVEAIVWHALVQNGHQPLWVGDQGYTIDAMRDHHLTSLLRLRVDWERCALDLQGRWGVTRCAVVEGSEWLLDGDELVPQQQWTRRVTPEQVEVDGRPMMRPEVTLQAVLTTAVQPLTEPIWQTNAQPLRVPVHLHIDAQWRAQDADRETAARTRVEHAAALLQQAGIELVVDEQTSWTPSPGSLSQQLASLPTARHGLVIGLSSASPTGGDREEVGRAELGGQRLVIADQPPLPGQPEAWDAIEEGIAIAHEVLHTLAIPHRAGQQGIMGPIKRGTIYQLSPSTRELAYTAAEARWSHWSPVGAIQSLTHAAETHLDRRDQLGYVLANLNEGIGAPIPGSVSPGDLTPLGNLAVAQAYARGTRSRQLRAAALAHTTAALATHPEASTLIEQLDTE